MRSTTTGCLRAGFGLAIAGYGVYAAAAWLRYGRPRPPGPDERDPLLDRFIPEYEVAERHHISVRASPETVLSAASQLDLRRSPLVRAIFDTRGLILRSDPAARPAQDLLSEVQALGWRVLAEVPGREIVFGAITQPWKANVVFECPRPEAFREDQRPEHVKIVWTLRADPLSRSAVDLSFGDPRGNDRRDRPAQVSSILGSLFRRDHPDPTRHDPRSQERRRA